MIRGPVQETVRVVTIVQTVVDERVISPQLISCLRNANQRKTKKAPTRGLRLLILQESDQEIRLFSSVMLLEEHETTDSDDVLIQNIFVIVFNFSVLSNQFQV